MAAFLRHRLLSFLPPGRARKWLSVGVGVLLGVVVVVVAYDWARVAAIKEVKTQGNQRLRLYAATIRSAVDRYSYLPSILAMDPEIRRMLVNLQPEAVSAANVRLEKINLAAQSANLYVMAPDGMTIAASNWSTVDTYVGNNYGFRPYFTDARDHGAGSFFGVGLTTKRPGYFMAAPIREGTAASSAPPWSRSTWKGWSGNGRWPASACWSPTRTASPSSPASANGAIPSHPAWTTA
ncbi:MAG: hypothetical protein NVV74_18725 [Magnetospirillum sp.]|nr:hypothetical protein [Magnetospirillum sp.]